MLNSTPATSSNAFPGASAFASSTNPAAQTLRVLVIEDDPPVREACMQVAAGLGFVVEAADSIASAQPALAKGSLDIVLLDLKLPGGNGFMLLEEIRGRHPAAVVVIMTAFATVSSAIEAIRVGAGDYLAKPFTIEELTATLERAAHRRSFDAEARQLRERLRTGRGMGTLIGRSPAMEKIYRILSKVAFTHHPVLILGESGTGKELVARSIHLNGPHADKPFVPVDCGALVPSLIESELFGHVKGAFTGADHAKTGLLASAEGGTIFLDEVGELPLDLQAKLLRALQEKEIRPVGSTHAVRISARILAATNRDLGAMVETGRFRKDLFFRLNVVNLRIPPLRERKTDIPLLAANVLERLGRDKKITYTFAEDAMRLLMDYDWPGNVRELEHAIERAAALSSGPVLHLGDFPTQLQNARLHLEPRYAAEPTALPAPAAVYSIDVQAEGATADAPYPSMPGEVLSIAEMEKRAILNALHQLRGDKLMAARLLGIGKTTLYRKLKEYGLTDDSF
jgi:two-component system response regulator HydG